MVMQAPRGGDASTGKREREHQEGGGAHRKGGEWRRKHEERRAVVQAQKATTLHRKDSDGCTGS